MGLKTSDLYLQGQIGLETCKFCAISVSVTTFEPFKILAST